MTAIDIAAMPVSERLKLMEALWDSLGAQPDSDVASPPWHGLALKQAEDELAEGAAGFIDWSQAKNLLRKNSST